MTLKINTMDSLENKNLSREGIIVRLAELNLQEEPVERTELDSLKQNFYKLRIAEVETARKAFEKQTEQRKDSSLKRMNTKNGSRKS